MVQDAVSPDLKILRPLTPPAPGVFPVYDDLSNRLLNPSEPFGNASAHPDRTVAHTLATCAGYAYSDAETVSTMMTRMGLENNRCRMIGEYVDAMFIMSTAFLVQSEDGRVVILAYRGTQPTSVINWLTNLDLYPTKVGFEINRAGPNRAGPFDVPGGFYRNVRATRYKVTEALLRAKQGGPVTAPPGEGKAEIKPKLKPMEALYITGHSLGGAMAAIQSIMLTNEPRHKENFGNAFRATYTFGQPMVGSPELGAACNADPFLGTNVIRYIFQKDPVPHLPPTTTGKFANFGREYQFRGDTWHAQKQGDQAGQMTAAVELVGAGLGAVAHLFPALRGLPFEYQLDDHGPQHYIAALTPPGVKTEFGDYNYTSPGGPRSVQPPSNGLSEIIHAVNELGADGVRVVNGLGELGADGARAALDALRRAPIKMF
jgi:hypothetical protein